MQEGLAQGRGVFSNIEVYLANRCLLIRKLITTIRLSERTAAREARRPQVCECLCPRENSAIMHTGT
jgi:hypothetical protein